jgi:hypothetical protein
MEWNIYANMKEEDLHSRVSLHAHGKADIQQSAGKRSAEVTVILSRTKDARCLRVFQVE